MTTSTPEMLPMAAEAPSDGASKKVLLAGGLAAAVALGGAGYFLLFSGGEDVASEGVATTTKITRPVAKPAVVTAKKPAAKPMVVPATSTARLGRDPFRALYVLRPVAATAPTTTTPTTSNSTTTSSSTVPGTQVGAEYTLKLSSISGTSKMRYFTFVVAGVKQTVVAGQRFGKYGELQVLATGVDAKGNVLGAVIQVGDDTPVEIAIGEKISVQ